MDHQVTSITQRFRLPTSCPLCKQYHRSQYAICSHCHALLQSIPTACYHCAYPLPQGTFLLCGRCSKKKPFIDHTIAAYRFEEPLRQLIHAFKYKEELYLCSYLANLILEHLTPEDKMTQCLIPIPLHEKRLKERGFNQAALLAKFLSKKLSIPYDIKQCSKQKNTKPQALLNAEERRHNLYQAFYCSSMAYQHVTLIDDILTTGSTANELAKTLKKQGVLRVDVWACAKAIL